MQALTLFKSLADGTRLGILLILSAHGELCVCEITGALAESQPKVSRHLALLKKQGLIQDRRQRQWVYYRLHDSLPAWARDILDTTTAGNTRLLAPLNRALARMARPSTVCSD